MAPVKRKFYFFLGARARGEVVRLMFAAKKVDFELILVEYPKQWETFQKETPFGKLPMLEIDGKKYAQSQAVQSYVAEEYGMYGSSSLDRLVINQLQGLREEVNSLEGDVFHMADSPEKTEKAKALHAIHIPRYLGYFTDFIKEYRKGKKFLLDKLSLADLCIFESCTTISQVRPDILAKYPEVVSLRQAVAETPEIKEYLAKRKECVI